MLVWFVSPAWRRFDVTRLALAQRAHLCGELAARGIDATCVVVADDENLEIAAAFGFDTVERDNEFLGRKFNDGIEHALRAGADVVVVMGSDDWLHVDAFDRLPLAEAAIPVPTAEQPAVTWTPGPEIVTGAGITIVDLERGLVRRCRSRGRSGCVPWLINRAALEPSFGRPIRETQQRGTDFALVLGLELQPTWVVHDPHPLCRVDFKSSTNINDFASTSGALADGPLLADPWSLLTEKYPAELVEMARDTHRAMAVTA